MPTNNSPSTTFSSITGRQFKLFQPGVGTINVRRTLILEGIDPKKAKQVNMMPESFVRASFAREEPEQKCPTRKAWPGCERVGRSKRDRE